MSEDEWEEVPWPEGYSDENPVVDAPGVIAYCRQWYDWSNYGESFCCQAWEDRWAGDSSFEYDIYASKETKPKLPFSYQYEGETIMITFGAVILGGAKNSATVSGPLAYLSSLL